MSFTGIAPGVRSDRVCEFPLEFISVQRGASRETLCTIARYNLFVHSSFLTESE